MSRYQFSEALFEGLLVEVVEEVVNAAKHWYRPTSTELAVFRKVTFVVKGSLYFLGSLCSHTLCTGHAERWRRGLARSAQASNHEA